ncbi:uncharacterized protein MONBRDRAFT_13003 [Monosiga brevicollis MX1]|uniref:Uncharacterized protein n=1 Tax=Monosiga brevicollis TaxID=81824 RepID=A9VDZ5_MONBE|nr:uncharacterized protein MONBRDRAFT_13003 [Monosiga brevicollis MX1]EDQ84222.1 predicted protein [Monosiga brevicollis MX1]|eukprot:XP_001750946.1 hypothetical protein [Monosiga brevicollis MX1]
MAAAAGSGRMPWRETLAWAGLSGSTSSSNGSGGGGPRYFHYTARGYEPAAKQDQAAPGTPKLDQQPLDISITHSPASQASTASEPASPLPAAPPPRARIPAGPAVQVGSRYTYPWREPDFAAALTNDHSDDDDDDDDNNGNIAPDAVDLVDAKTGGNVNGSALHSGHDPVDQKAPDHASQADPPEANHAADAQAADERAALHELLQMQLEPTVRPTFGQQYKEDDDDDDDEDDDEDVDQDQDQDHGADDKARRDGPAQRKSNKHSSSQPDIARRRRRLSPASRLKGLSDRADDVSDHDPHPAHAHSDDDESDDECASGRCRHRHLYQDRLAYRAQARHSAKVKAPSRRPRQEAAGSKPASKTHGTAEASRVLKSTRPLRGQTFDDWARAKDEAQRQARHAAREAEVRPFFSTCCSCFCHVPFCRSVSSMLPGSGLQAEQDRKEAERLAAERRQRQRAEDMFFLWLNGKNKEDREREQQELDAAAAAQAAEEERQQRKAERDRQQKKSQLGGAATTHARSASPRPAWQGPLDDVDTKPAKTPGAKQHTRRSSATRRGQSSRRSSSVQGEGSVVLSPPLLWQARLYAEQTRQPYR